MGARESKSGKGVVADETRTLAQRSADAAKGIKAPTGRRIERDGNGARPVTDVG